MSSATGTSTRDHPRVCGEHALLRLGCINVGGSSPRVRGTLLSFSLSMLMEGIIPACAGNTSKAEEIGLDRRDHPRVCGEHS